jgi:hypothetical protein
MRYAVLIFDAPGAYDALPEGELERVMREYDALAEDPRCVGGAQLQGAQTATRVRVADGEILRTDGPFVESKEIFGGYYLLEVPDRSDALEFATRVPAARLGGCVEVRPAAHVRDQ